MSSDRPGITVLTPYMHVADVARSVAFYRRLGLEVRDVAGDGAAPTFAYLAGPGGHGLMLAAADEPVRPEQQAVLLYAWTEDVEALRLALLRDGVAVGEVTRPDHMPDGEIRFADPDGYVVLAGQRRGRDAAPG